MPIYEYICSRCGHRFEALVFGTKVPDCPRCGSSKLEKLFSAFAVGSGPAAPSGGG